MLTKFAGYVSNVSVHRGEKIGAKGAMGDP